MSEVAKTPVLSQFLGFLFNFEGIWDFSQGNELYQFVPINVFHVSTKLQRKLMTIFIAKSHQSRFWRDFEGFFKFGGNWDFSQGNEIYQFVPHVVLQVSAELQEKVMSSFRVKSKNPDFGPILRGF